MRCFDELYIIDFEADCPGCGEQLAHAVTGSGYDDDTGHACDATFCPYCETYLARGYVTTEELDAMNAQTLGDDDDPADMIADMQEATQKATATATTAPAWTCDVCETENSGDACEECGSDKPKQRGREDDERAHYRCEI